MSSVEELVAAFDACQGSVMATDARTGVMAKVVRIEDLNPGGRGQVHFAVFFEDGGRREFRASSADRSFGDYLSISIYRPLAQGAEPTEIQIYDGGNEDYHPPEGSGSWGPGLALTLVNDGAKERNQALVATHQAEQERIAGERRMAENAARQAHYAAYRDRHIAPLLESLCGHPVTGMTLEGGELVLEIEDAPPVRITVKSVGVRLAGGGIMELPGLEVRCGECCLSGHDSVYFSR